ncbi:MAG: transposase [Anaerolineae bacterium]|nr:transposase [Anaerolineae bacterium]
MTTPRRGRPVPITHCCASLRAIFIKYWFDLSLRQLEERCAMTCCCAGFLGYGLHQETPDHTTLQPLGGVSVPAAPRSLFLATRPRPD